MGLRSNIQESIAAAFDSDLSDAVKTFTITRFNDVTYNPSTLSNSNSSTLIGSGRGVFDKYSINSYIDNAAKPIDTAIICLSNELTIVPLIDDYITDSNGVNYKITYIKEDPANISTIIGCMTSYGSI